MLCILAAQTTFLHFIFALQTCISQLMLGHHWGTIVANLVANPSQGQRRVLLVSVRVRVHLNLLSTHQHTSCLRTNVLLQEVGAYAGPTDGHTR